MHANEASTEVIIKLFIAEILGLMFPSVLEFSGVILSPRVTFDALKYIVLYMLNITFIFSKQEVRRK